MQGNGKTPIAGVKVTITMIFLPQAKCFNLISCGNIALGEALCQLCGNTKSMTAIAKVLHVANCIEHCGERVACSYPSYGSVSN